MRRSLSILACASLALLSACGASGDRAAVQKYLTDAEPIATELSATGSRFETLMNAQADGLDWTDEENAQLQDILADMSSLKTRAENMTVPAELASIHPLLPQSVAKMIEAIQIVQGIVDAPENANDDVLDGAVAKTEEGGKLAQQYVDSLGALLQQRYPDLLEE